MKVTVSPTIGLAGLKVKSTVGAAGGLTVRVKLVVLMTFEVLVPVIVMVWLPVGVACEVLMAISEVNVGLPLAGVKVTVVPAGTPLAVRATFSVVPAVRVAVTMAAVLPPRTTLAALGLTERL